MNDIYWNLNTQALYEQAIRHREGIMAHLGPLVVRTGHHTGRSANDKFIAQEPTTEKIFGGENQSSHSCGKF
ncbi:Phosphoenolpyruvate carboxykinase (ATP) [Beggiatoa sp. PS]|nr:Phosphoenolpyruvate carboxykinase (ATP) [Beggiatoa sp. PS]